MHRHGPAVPRLQPDFRPEVHPMRADGPPAWRGLMHVPGSRWLAVHRRILRPGRDPQLQPDGTGSYLSIPSECYRSTVVKRILCVYGDGQAL
eukprot:scaffold658318_cov39-Prasinocladus_malaysianus.AAC.2